MNALELIAAERERQVVVKGWTPEHDDTHNNDELAKMAAVYATPARLRTNGLLALVPWSASMPSPRTRSERVRELVKAGALVAAEIERIQRAGTPEGVEVPAPDCLVVTDEMRPDFLLSQLIEDQKSQIAALVAAGEALQSALDGCAMRLRFFAEVNSGSRAIKSGEPIDRSRPPGTPTCEQNVEAISRAYEGWKAALQTLEPRP
jgi:hypothetical protein